MPNIFPTNSKVVLLICLLVTPTAQSMEDFELQQLKQLFNKQQRGQAYEYANKHLASQEGDPYFDYYYGVSAIDAGHASEGVFALERVLLHFPEDHVARLELARGYFILEEYARSRQEFEQVLQGNPPELVQQNAQIFLDQIRLKESRYKTTSNGYVEMGVGSDSNVNSAPDADVIVSGTLLEDSTGQDDTFINAAASYQIVHPFAPGWTVNAGITGDIRKNTDFSQFDNITATLQFGMSALDAQSKYSINGVVQQFNLDGDDYRMLSGLNLGWRYSLSETSSLNTGLQYAMLDYDTLPNLNSSLTVINFNYNKRFATWLSPVIFAGLNVGMENPDDNDAFAKADVERDIVGVKLGMVLNLSSRLALQTALGTQKSDYNGPQQSGDPVTRNDTYNTADINLLWLFSKNWRLDTKLAYSKNDSNVATRNYDRTRISLNINYAF